MGARGARFRGLTCLLEGDTADAALLVAGRRADVREAPARSGDARGTYTVGEKAARLPGWRAALSLEDWVRSAFTWAARRVEILAS